MLTLLLSKILTVLLLGNDFLSINDAEINYKTKFLTLINNISVLV